MIVDGRGKPNWPDTTSFECRVSATESAATSLRTPHSGTCVPLLSGSSSHAGVNTNRVRVDANLPSSSSSSLSSIFNGNFEDEDEDDCPSHHFSNTLVGVTETAARDLLEFTL